MYLISFWDQQSIFKFELNPKKAASLLNIFYNNYTFEEFFYFIINWVKVILFKFHNMAFSFSWADPGTGTWISGLHGSTGFWAQAGPNHYA